MLAFLLRLLTRPVVIIALLAIVATMAVDRCRQVERQRNQAFAVATANAKASHYQLAYNTLAEAWEDRATQFGEQEALVARLRAQNAELAEELLSRDQEILSLTETITELDTALEESQTTIAPVDDTHLRVQLDESVSFRGGGLFRVSGELQIETTEPSVTTELVARGSFPLTIVISRGENQEIVVNAFTGDPRLQITRLDVTKSFDLLTNTESNSMFSSVFNKVLYGAIGFGLCRLIW